MKVGVALHGNLKDFGLAEVFQLIGQQRKTGLLEIQGSGLTMRLAFADGAVVWAQPASNGEHTALGEMLVRCGLVTQEKIVEYLREAEASARSLPQLVLAQGDASPEDLEATLDLLTRETIFQVLRWTQGSFHFSAQTVPHDRPPEKLLAAEQILMDGLRMIDEWQTFAEHIPSGEAVFQRCTPFDVYRHQAQGDARRRLPHAQAVYQLVDGRLTVRRVIDLSRLGTFEATRLLAELLQAGILQVSDPGTNSSKRRKRTRKREPGASLAYVQHAFSACLPVACLAWVVALILGSFPQLPTVPLHETRARVGVAIPRAPFEAARRGFERRRLRNSVEAHRFQHGDWPERLADLAVGGDALTATSGDPYYYVRNGDGILLLTPPQ